MSGRTMSVMRPKRRSSSRPRRPKALNRTGNDNDSSVSRSAFVYTPSVHTAISSSGSAGVEPVSSMTSSVNTAARITPALDSSWRRRLSIVSAWRSKARSNNGDCRQRSRARLQNVLEGEQVGRQRRPLLGQHDTEGIRV